MLEVGGRVEVVVRRRQVAFGDDMLPVCTSIPVSSSDWRQEAAEEIKVDGPR